MPAPSADPLIPSDSAADPSSQPADSDGSDVDPDYVPSADVDLSSASSSGEMSEDPVSDDESPSVPLFQPSSADSVPGTPSPLPARAPRRRKYKPKIDVTTVRLRKSVKSSPVDSLPTVPPTPDPSAPVTKRRKSAEVSNPLSAAPSPDDVLPSTDYDCPPCPPPVVEGVGSPVADQTADSPVLESASLSSSSPSHVPDVSAMETAVPERTTSPRWCTRMSAQCRSYLSSTGHSSDTHVYEENYDSDDVYLGCIFDFGSNTYKILKDARTFEDARFHKYRLGAVSFPEKTVFPGVVATDCCGLPSVLPLSFPGEKKS